MSSSPPLISVIIPTYNRGHLVTEAIDSVLNQTYSNFELLVVDDHSTDNTKEIVESYNDPRVKYLVNKRTKGAQGARNTGIYSAKGDWIAFLDSDDVWLDTKLEVQLSILESEKKAIGITCGYFKYNFENGEIREVKIPDKKVFRIEDILKSNQIGSFSAFICKKEIALEVQGVDERFPALQDRDFYTTILGYGDIYSVKELLLKYREDNADRITKDFERRLTALRLYHDKYSKVINKTHINSGSIYFKIFICSILTKKPFKLNNKYIYFYLFRNPTKILKLIKAIVNRYIYTGFPFNYK